MKLFRVKNAILFIFACGVIVICFVPLWVKIVLITVGFACIFTIALFIVLNKLIKQTNWWKNNFVFTKQFYNGWTYRSTPVRNLQIANVGSNPARFAFHYDDVLGENWSTGTQGLDMDLQVLRHQHSLLRKGAYVLLPIVQFSSVSGYLDKFPKSKLYLAKYTKVLDYLQIKQLSCFDGVYRFIKYPLLYNWRNVLYLINDVQPDTRLAIVENPMQKNEMIKDAKNWMKCWMEEFNIKDLHATLSPELQKARERSIDMMCDMISFLLERGYRPVLISTPMSEALSEHFSEDIKETYIYSFVRSVQEKYDIPYIDYMDSEYSNNEYFFNALFMNLRGRKLFTRRVLKDLGLIND